MRRFAFFLFVLAFSLPSFAEAGNALTASIADPLFVSVRRLALASGSPPPPAVSPISRSELEFFLRQVRVELLSPELLKQYRQTLQELSVLEDSSLAGVGLQSSFEGYFHLSDEPDVWNYWYPDRKALVSIPITVVPFLGLAIDATLDWRKNYPVFPGYPSYETVNADPLSNVFSDLRETDVQFPFFALLSAAGAHWSVQFGRSRIAWGSGHGGSLLLSDHVEYHDFLMASVFGNIASYRALYLDLEAWKNASGVTDPDRAYLAHRIELRPFSWLSLAANEAMIFHGKPMELRYLNPLMILHSWFTPQYGNSMINLEAAVRPIPGLEVWAHLAIDQIQSAVERERGYADSEPEAIGYLAGVEYVMPLGNSWLTGGTEWAYLNPWMYIGRSELGSFSYRRRVQAENVLPSGGKVIVEKSLGYPAGPDHYGVTGYLILDTASRITGSLEISLLAKGENDVGRSMPPIDEEDASRVTPSGVPEFAGVVRISGDALLASLQLRSVPLELSAGGVLDIIRVQNHDHVADAVLWDVQLSPYLTLSTRVDRSAN